jgi:DNA-binding response OmpR family regulator
MKYKVLFAEDDPVLAQIISDGLESSGYDVLRASNGREALVIYENDHPDICVLDIMMPLMDGYMLAEGIRKINGVTPIIFLSAKSMTEDVIKGFESGGNDYLKKPFNMGELLVRIQSLLTRFGHGVKTAGKQTVYEFGNCRLDTLNQELYTSKTKYDLSYKEVALLELLLINKNAILARQEPLIKIWGDDSHYNSRSMDVFMAHLRKMLKEETGVQIMSIRGIGYRLLC